MEGLKLIAKGAEADLWLNDDWNGRRVIIKRRGPKLYRHSQLDEVLRSARTIRETDILHRAKEAGVPSPIIYHVYPSDSTIIMQFIEGEKVRDIVSELDNDERKKLFRLIGVQAGRLHKNGIVHGDLTTSNMILSGDLVVFIDFGLGEISKEAEKRGVDLHLMRRMLTSTHFTHADELFSAFTEGYRDEMGDEVDEVLSRMEEIERRGRYVDRENPLDGDR